MKTHTLRFERFARNPAAPAVPVLDLRLTATAKNVGTAAIRRIAEALRSGTGDGIRVRRFQGPSRNPTLVHHGWAQGASFHVFTSKGAPLADLYVGEKLARAVARILADHMGTTIHLAPNDAGGEGGRLYPGESARRDPFNAPGATDVAPGERANPRVAKRLKWNMYAGGTGAWEGAHGYDARTPWGQYTVDPVTTQYGRRAGYLVRFNVGGPGLLPLPAHMHQPGLYRELGRERSPNAAKGLAQAHHEAVIAGEAQPNPGAAAGQVWSKPGGGRVRVLEIAGPRVQVLDMESGGREWFMLSEFYATHRAPVRRNPRQLSVPERHQLKIARDTLKMSEPIARVMGGPTHAQAAEIIHRLTGKWPVPPKGNPSRSRIRAKLPPAQQLTARLVKELGFSAVADYILTGAHGAEESIHWLLGQSLPESRKIILRAALVVLERERSGLPGGLTHEALAEVKSAAMAQAAREREARGVRGNPVRGVDKRSIRTIERAGKLLLIGCPAGHYHPRKRSRRKCDVGTRRVNPRGARQLYDAAGNGIVAGAVVQGFGLHNAGRHYTVRAIKGQRIQLEPHLGGKAFWTKPDWYRVVLSENPDDSRTAYFDRFTLELPAEAVADMSGQGRADEAVEHWAGRIQRPSEVTPAKLKAELKEFGAWDAAELADDSENWRRILWIAAGNIRDEASQDNPSRGAGAKRGRTAKRKAYRGTRMMRAADARARAVKAGGSGASELARFAHMRASHERRFRKRLAGNPADEGYFHGGKLAADGWVEFTRAEWAKVHRDFKGYASDWTEFGKMYGGGTPSVMGREAGHGLALYPVRIVDAKNLGRRTPRSNPRPFVGDELERARDTFNMWHEFDSHKLERVAVPSRTIPRHLVKLGEVVRIDYKSNKWEGQPVTYTHSTKRPRPLLVTDPDARQLFLVGGKMRPTADGLVN